MHNKIKQKRAKIAVIGLGYVGLPLALEFAKCGFNVTGLDLDKKKIKACNAGKTYISDIGEDSIRPVVENGMFRATDDFSALGGIDVIFICVPTPFTPCKEPDVSYIIAASNSIVAYMKKPQLIILESTTYPGTTEEVVLPILQSTGKKAGKDFYLVFSPERVDPGNTKFSISNTPKVIGGLDKYSTDIALALYAQVITPDRVIPVSSPKIAEMTKLLENTFRSVNIALINELTLLCDRMKIDIWEVIDAAASKPFGYMPFYPGPGVGGHCIPVDPYYLSWKAREFDFYTKFIELSAEINLSMPRYVVSKIGEALNDAEKSIKGSKILALGVAFKPNINDARNSPSIRVIEELLAKGGIVDYCDPYIPKIGNGKAYFEIETQITHMDSIEFKPEKFGKYDAVVILVDHKEFDLEKIVKNSKLIIDAKNACKRIKPPKGVKIVKI